MSKYPFLNRFGSVFVFVLLLTSPCFKNSRSMDIADIMVNQRSLDSFIQSNFDKAGYGSVNPLIYYKIDYVNRTDSLTFCSMSIVQCWVRRTDSLYAFFILVKRSANSRKNITEKYGSPTIMARIDTQGIPIGAGLFMWRKEQLNIELTTYFNTAGIPKYEMCDLIICGNSKRDQLLSIK